MTDYPHVHHDRVRFRDCDAMGHVNNAVYSTYLEEARIGVLGDLVDFILARVERGASVPVPDALRARLNAALEA